MNPIITVETDVSESQTEILSNQSTHIQTDVTSTQAKSSTCHIIDMK